MHVKLRTPLLQRAHCKHGTWTDDEKIVIRRQGPAARFGARCTHAAPTFERYLIAFDHGGFAVNRHDESTRTRIVANRACTLASCAPEGLTTRMTSVIVIIGMRLGCLDFATRRCIHVCLRDAIKKLEKSCEHPLEHIERFPDDPNDQFAWPNEPSPRELEPDLLAQLDTFCRRQGSDNSLTRPLRRTRAHNARHDTKSCNSLLRMDAFVQSLHATMSCPPFYIKSRIKAQRSQPAETTFYELVRLSQRCTRVAKNRGDTCARSAPAHPHRGRDSVPAIQLRPMEMRQRSHL